MPPENQTPAAHHRPRASSELRRSVAFTLIVLGYFIVVEATIGWWQLAARARQAGMVPVALVALALTASYVLRSLRLRSALAAAGPPRLLDVVRVFAVHNAANWLLPARTGEVSLPLQLRRHFGVPLPYGAGLLMWLRLQDLHVVATLGGLVLLAFGHDGWRWAGVPTLLAGLSLPALGWHFAPLLTRRVPRLQRVLAAAPREAGAVIRDLALSWLAWTVKLAGLGLALALLVPLPPAAGILGALGGDVAAILPVHAPLGAGTYESGVLLGLLPWSPDLAAALGAAVQLHALLLCAALCGGGLGLTLRTAAASSHPAGADTA